MRVTQSLNQTQFLSALDSLESNLSQTQNQISSGVNFTTPSQDPIAAGAVNNYDQALSQSKQYTANGNSAQTSLQTEDTALSQLQSQLQSLRSLALEANSGTQTGEDLTAIAEQATQIQNSLLSLANTQDGNGQYIFSGFATQTEPFSLTATGASYAGDQGQNQVQIAPGQTLASGDNGDVVFNQIKTGNGTFTVTANAANTGSGLLGATTVTGAAGYSGKTYSISFTAPNAYQVHDSLGNLVTSGAYTSGQTISFGGAQVTLTGTPATGDSFSVTPSGNQSLFTTVQNLITAIQTGASSPAAVPALNNSVATALNNIDQAISQTSTVQASVGGRLNTITTQQSVQTSQQTQLQQSISSLQSLDYASAITSLDSQNTTLSAAMQAYTLTQGLSLFKYIS
ncbi:MAG TPA: flagellar hook-associated protein FlgL [Steroidobacteraceae bacterium]|jgi:flagellar hook-associated protein 3 FlgL|nr:flagellar hook-associated protein FlgL [Steroidobacteraceae bacterium]